MSITKKTRYISFAIAIILLVLGIRLAMPETDSSFLCTKNTFDVTTFQADNLIKETPMCTVTMLNDGMSMMRNVSTTITRWRDKAKVIFLLLGVFLQYRFYQSTECKEDGQLFLCRTVVVDYIHLKDSGE